MNNKKGRKALYLLPHIFISKEINFDAFSLIPMEQKYELCKELIPKNVLDILKYGTLIETPFFSSGDIFNSEDNAKINRLIKLMIFSYYTKNLGLYCLHHQPANVFDIFVFIERNQDPSFEFKSSYFNGLHNFSYTQEINYVNKILSIKKNHIYIKIYEHSFSYFECYKHLCDDYDFINIADKFIKTKSLYPIEDLSLVYLYARISIESALTYLNINKKKYVSKFITECFNRLELFVEKNKQFSYLFKYKIKPLHEKYNVLELIIDDYLTELADARHSFVHNGDNISRNTQKVLNFYFVWFPLFFNIYFSSKKNDVQYDIKLINFFLLIQKNIHSWSDISFGWPQPANAITSYEMDSINMYKMFRSNDHEKLKCILNVRGQNENSIKIYGINIKLTKQDKLIFSRRAPLLNNYFD